MNFYQLLTGAKIDMGLIPGTLQVFTHEMINRTKEALEGKGDGAGLKPFDFAAEVQEHLSQEYQGHNEYIKVLHGPVGAIYRDCFYRLYAREYAKNGTTGVSEAEKEQEFIENIRFNPGRILMDRFLDGTSTQLEFSRDAGLDPGAVSRLFNYVLNPEMEAEPSISLKRLHQTCRLLHIVPLAGYGTVGNPSSVGELPLRYNRTAGFTTRERQLRTLIAAVTRSLAFSPYKEEERARRLNVSRAFLGLHLAALYGIDDVLTLNHVTNSVFEDILTVPQIVEVGSVGQTETRVADGDGSLPDDESLLKYLEEFQLGTNDRAGNVAFTVTELRADIKKALDESRRHTFHKAAGDTAPEGEFEYFREAIREGWGRALKIFRRWFASEIFNSWDPSDIEPQFQESSGAEPSVDEETEGAFSPELSAEEEKVAPRSESSYQNMMSYETILSKLKQSQNEVKSIQRRTRGAAVGGRV
ncbi:MAG: hypothetical protein LC803_08950 [Acidobacteria bacterium]|nr:hypothetical protein [Acidobacteriota bacterium]